MAAPGETKTAWKLQEIVAHASNVSSVVLGKSSGRLLATGGEDCRVNLWSVNKSNCIMSLTGHTSPAECVRFSTKEELLVAGSRSGSLRVWDLEAAKSLRTLSGHKANICSLDFHPYGKFVASGSMDTNIKLWDIRRKGCVFQYKGHLQAVRCLRFSPDGKWIASSGDDNTVKLWDITAGKIMADFTVHTGPVNVVEFHPNEYLLASGSSDRTVKFWDLEKFELVSCSEGVTSAVRTIVFHSDGCCLYSGSLDSLQVYGWEPERCFDVVQVNWGKISDLAVCSNQLIGVSSDKTNVSIYVVDLKRVRKSGSVLHGLLQDDSSLSRPVSKGTSFRRNYERPMTTCSKPQRREKQECESEQHSPENERRSPSSEDEKDEKESAAEIQNPEEYKQIFQPKNVISRTPPRKNEPFPAPPEDDTSVVKEATKPGFTADIQTPKPNKSEFLQVPPLSTSTPVHRVEPVMIPVAKNEPIGLRVADFLLVQPARNNYQVDVNEDAVLQIRKGHDTMCAILVSRHKSLDTVKAIWTSGEIKTSLDSAVAMNDLSVVVDVLNIINLKPSLWKLDLCTAVLPQVEKLIQSKYESYVQTGCTSLKLILQRFLPLISDTLSAPPPIGVDITREERLQKCRACHKQLKNMSNVVQSKAGSAGRHGSAFRELNILMLGLDNVPS